MDNKAQVQMEECNPPGPSTYALGSKNIDARGKTLKGKTSNGQQGEGMDKTVFPPSAEHPRLQGAKTLTLGTWRWVGTQHEQKV